MSRRLYSNHIYVKSGLASGTMWDMMMKYMKDTGNVDITSTTWGNHDNTSLTNLSRILHNVNSSTSIKGETDGFKSTES